MTKRLYFTCPIKALYMMKEFDVKFYIEEKLINCKQFSSCDLPTIEYDDKTIQIDFEEEYLYQILGSFAEIKNLKSKIYVAPESKYIFEPQKGDIGVLIEKWGRIEEFYIVERKHWGSMHSEFNYKWFKGKEEVCITEKVEITMRVNAQFFMPEVENGQIY